MKKFQELFTKLLEYAIKFPELKEKLLSMLYIFLVAQCKTVMSQKKNEEADRNSLPVSKHKIKNIFKSKGLFSSHFVCLGIKHRIKGRKGNKRRNSVDNKESILHLSVDAGLLNVDKKTRLSKRNSNKIKNESDEELHSNPKTPRERQKLEKGRLSETQFMISPRTVNDQGSEDNNPETQPDEHANNILNNRENGEEHFGYVWAKFPEPNYWKRYYLK